MNKTLRRTLIGLWVLIATTYLTKITYAYPIYFPKWTQPFWFWLFEALGLNNDEIFDMEIMIVFVISFIVVSMITYLAVIIWNRFHKPKTNYHLNN